MITLIALFLVVALVLGVFGQYFEPRMVNLIVGLVLLATLLFVLDRVGVPNVPQLWP